jgi:hypothetical protein
MIDLTPGERYQRTAWSIAMSHAIETGEPAVDFYKKLMKKSNNKQVPEATALDESNET